MDREPCRGAPVYDGGKRCSSHSEDLARQQQLSRRLARDLDLDPGEIAELKALMSRTEADDLAWRESEKRRRQRDGASE